MSNPISSAHGATAVNHSTNDKCMMQTFFGKSISFICSVRYYAQKKISVIWCVLPLSTRLNVHIYRLLLDELSGTDVNHHPDAQRAHERCISGIISCAVASPPDLLRGGGLGGFFHPCCWWMIERGKACRDMLIVFAISTALTAPPSQYLNPVYPSEAEAARSLKLTLLIVGWPWASK